MMIRWIAGALFVVCAGEVRPALVPFVMIALGLGWWARGAQDWRTRGKGDRDGLA